MTKWPLLYCSGGRQSMTKNRQPELRVAAETISSVVTGRHKACGIGMWRRLVGDTGLDPKSDVQLAWERRRSVHSLCVPYVRLSSPTNLAQRFRRRCEVRIRDFVEINHIIRCHARGNDREKACKSKQTLDKTLNYSGKQEITQANKQ